MNKVNSASKLLYISACSRYVETNRKTTNFFGEVNLDSPGGSYDDVRFDNDTKHRTNSKNMVNEDKTKPFCVLYWKQIFGIVIVLLLVGCACAGIVFMFIKCLSNGKNNG